MGETLSLYHYYRSSCSWRVRWALNIKGLAYQGIPVNLLEDQHNAPAYLSKNPSGQVPCLAMGQEFYSESLAILEWLEETHPQPTLLPQDPRERMRVRQLCYIISSGTQPLQNLSAQRYHSAQREEQLSYARHWIDKGLQAYENLLWTGISGSFSFGGQLSMADLCLIPQCYNALRFGVELKAYPRIAAIYERCISMDSCQRSAPESFAP